MKKIADWMDAAIAHHEDEAFLAKQAAEVAALCAKFPVPGLD
jgi:glycine/serine hydroxymethyltransferase